MLTGPGDVGDHRERHPAFYGAFDWHSAVHAHWCLARLRRVAPAAAGDAEAVLAAHLTPAALATEQEVLEDDPVFERPYGWAWLLALATECARHEDAPWAEALEPLRALVAGRIPGWLGAEPRPERSGTHGNSAFALLLVLDHARARGDGRLEEEVVGAARRWYLHDRDAPARLEPSAHDFLSPTLTEAHLMGAVLPTGAFEEWYEAWLPGSAEVIPPAIREPVPAPHPEDPQRAHLAGLALSRGWSWRAIARALPARDERRTAALDAADTHLAAGLEHLEADAYASSHWLHSFALLAIDGL